MIPIKNTARGATYMTAATNTRIVARSRRWLVTDSAMAEMARAGPSTPSHIAESKLNQCDSVGSVSVSHANKNPSENCQIKKPATIMMRPRRAPLVLVGHSRSLFNILQFTIEFAGRRGRIPWADVVRHKMRDYGQWRPIFDRHVEMQRAAGLTNPRVRIN